MVRRDNRKRVNPPKRRANSEPRTEAEHPEQAGPGPGPDADSQIPSGGALFTPAKHPFHEFLAEIRLDLQVPIHVDIPPRGFHNPGMLCYRNALLAALLNTNRFLSFLYVHVRRVRFSYFHEPRISGHLLMRLYHLAMAYWSRDGLHPMSSADSYERLCTLFWRACKARPDDETAEQDGGGVPSWRTRCDRQDRLEAPDGTADRLPPLHERQQDASEFYDWLMSKMVHQLGEAAAVYGGPAKSRACFAALTQMHATTRYVCRQCRHPVRIRKDRVEDLAGLKLHVAAPQQQQQQQRRGPAAVQPLEDYLARFFDEDIEGPFRCERCARVSNPRRRIMRLQSTPEVLGLQLGRIVYADGAQAKATTPVACPEFLDLSRWLEPHVYGTDSRVIYRLAAVVSHQGDHFRAGHYVTYVRGTTSGAAFAPMDTPAAALAAVDEARQRDARTDATLDALGPRPSPAAVRDIEDRRSCAVWTRIDNAHTQPGFSLRRLTNATRDRSHRPGSDGWYDPVLLLYEKWVETFHTDAASQQRLYAVPMNVGQTHATADAPLPDQARVFSTTAPPGVFGGEAGDDDPDAHHGTMRDVHDNDSEAGGSGGESANHRKHPPDEVDRVRKKPRVK